MNWTPNAVIFIVLLIAICVGILLFLAAAWFKD